MSLPPHPICVSFAQFKTWNSPNSNNYRHTQVAAVGASARRTSGLTFETIFDGSSKISSIPTISQSLPNVSLKSFFTYTLTVQSTPLNVDTSGGCDFVHINRLSRLSGVAYGSGQKFKTTHV